MSARHGLTVHCDNVVHIYTTVAGHDVVALRGVNLDIQEGEQVALLGPSGSGKSTLLGLFGGVQRPSAGRVLIGGRDISRVNEVELGRLRAGKVASLLQGAARNLLPYATARGNIEFARKGLPYADVRRLPSADDLLARLGMKDLTDRPVSSLSGGERQRIALAATVSSGAGLLLADEPTSQLGHEDRDALIGLVQEVSSEFGTTVVMVTHDREVADRMPRRITIRNGRIGSEGIHGLDFAVVDQDGAVHLPDELSAGFPAGTLVAFEEADGGLILRPVDVERSPEGGHG